MNVIWTWKAILFLLLLNTFGLLIAFVAGWREGYKEGKWEVLQITGALPFVVDKSDIKKPSWSSYFTHWPF